MEQPVILCVDNERIVLNGLQAQLHREFGQNYIIKIAESGEEALELIAEMTSDEIDLPIIISDQLMPGKVGSELHIATHSLLPNTLKILLTGQSDIQSISEYVNNADLYRYMEKPWDGPLSYQVNLFDVKGRLIKTVYNKRVLSLSDAVSGIYLIEIKDLNTANRVVERIIVNR